MSYVYETPVVHHMVHMTRERIQKAIEAKVADTRFLIDVQCAEVGAELRKDIDSFWMSMWMWR